MALTKEIKVDKIEVLELGNVQVRTATVIKEDDVELSRSFNRHVEAHVGITTQIAHGTIQISQAKMQKYKQSVTLNGQMLLKQLIKLLTHQSNNTWNYQHTSFGTSL